MTVSLNTVLVVLVLLQSIVVAVLLGNRAYGGELDPTAPPADSMISLDLLGARWARELDSTNGVGAGCNSDRFRCTFFTRVFPELGPSPKAVIDRGTGLVWERSPQNAGFTWHDAVDACYGKTVGGRMGWRLPSVAELQSLFDLSADHLPNNHPFVFSPSIAETYWTSERTDNLLSVYLFSSVPESPVSASSSNTLSVWCVRGGAPRDVPAGGL
jgi:hypothetical protein